MLNIEALDKRIRESGLKRKKIAESLGLTLAGLKKKTSGRSEFKASEVSLLCQLLGISSVEDKDKIFFT